jgi:hypothetical protein
MLNHPESDKLHIKPRHLLPLLKINLEIIIENTSKELGKLPKMDGPKPSKLLREEPRPPLSNLKPTPLILKENSIHSDKDKPPHSDKDKPLHSDKDKTPHSVKDKPPLQLILLLMVVEVEIKEHLHMEELKEDKALFSMIKLELLPRMFMKEKWSVKHKEKKDSLVSINWNQ